MNPPSPRHARPPRLAAAVLRRLADGRDADYMLADIGQEFEERAAMDGEATARRWYWRQARRSMGPLAARRIASLAAMLPPAFADVRYASRLARRAPVAMLAITLAIALGIAASTAIFSVMEAVFLQPLPFPQPDRLVQFNTTVQSMGFVPEVNFLDARDWRDGSVRLSAIGLYDVGPGIIRLEPGGTAQSATLLSAGAELMAALELRPLLGRDFTADEFRFGGPPVVMLGHHFWRSRFGADRLVIGRSMILGSVTHTIVGILPPEADRFPAGGADVWSPLTFPGDSFLNQRGSIALSAVGRLREHVMLATAQDELTSIAGRLALAYPETNEKRSVRIVPLQEAMVGPVRPMMLLLAGAIAMLLAVACANIANLLLAQAHARRLELGIRAAVGASPSRLVAQLWTETLALFAIAGALGLALAPLLARALVARYPDTLPLAADIRLDARVLLFAAASTLGAGLLAGLPRARRAARSDDGDLHAGARAGISRSHRRTAAVFVAAQVAISMVLLFSGVLLLRTFINMTATHPGFDPKDVVTIRASIPADVRTTAQRTVDAQDTLAGAARAIPGVTEAAHAMFIPFAPGSWGDGYTREGRADPPPAGPMAHFFMVSPEYLKVMSLPILRGRGITPADGPSSPRVLVVSDTFARRAFADEDAVGKRLQWNDGTWQIVGVTADVRHASLAEPPDADVYVPRRQVVRGNTWLVIKTARPALAVLAELQQRMRAIDPGVALTDAVPMQRRLDANAAPQRFRAIVTGTLAALTLLLAVVGLHAAVCYAVAQRTREIGVRLALGQPRGSILRGVLGDTLRTIVIGAVPGILVSIYAGRWLASVVMVEASPAAALGIVLAIFSVAALIAAAGPALRASRVDPIVALRN